MLMFFPDIRRGIGSFPFLFVADGAFSPVFVPRQPLKQRLGANVLGGKPVRA
jgi:hypothetical protein